MNKQRQLLINEKCITALNEVNNEISFNGMQLVGRLRTCSAYVYETNGYYILKSYNTIVAFINKENDTLYDVLRYVYGYTSTSAQHISKFNEDYCVGSWGCGRSFRYYAIW